jgi:peroxiredoxin
MANHENIQNVGAGPIPNQIPPNEQNSFELPMGFQAGLGLAVASLVLSLTSLPFAFFVIGLIPGLIGLILAIVHLHKKRLFRAMATWGLVLSILGCLASAGFGTYYGISIYAAYKLMGDMDFGESHMFEEFIGTESPDFTMTDIQGNTTKLSELKGKRIILDFWATWCPPCKKEIPHFIDLRKETDPDKLVIIGISDEDIEMVREFATEKKINYTIATADDLPAPYSDIVSIPTTFFIDSKCIIQSVLTGYHSFDVLKENALAPDYQPDPNEPAIVTATDH